MLVHVSVMKSSGEIDVSWLVNLRVDPEGSGINRVANTDVSRSSLSEAHPRKHTERTSHVLQLPLSLLVRVLDLGDAGVGDASRGDGGKVRIHLGLGGGSRGLGAGGERR